MTLETIIKNMFCFYLKERVKKIIINNKKLSNYKLNYKINKRSLIH